MDVAFHLGGQVPAVQASDSQGQGQGHEIGRCWKEWDPPSSVILRMQVDVDGGSDIVHGVGRPDASFLAGQKTALSPSKCMCGQPRLAGSSVG